MGIIMILSFGGLFILTVALCVWSVYEIIMVIYRKTLRYETFYANVSVCKKEKFLVPKFYDEAYNVYLMYEDKLHCIDSKKLYEEVNVGDIVRVKVHKGYNGQNEVKNVYLSIED